MFLTTGPGAARAVRGLRVVPRPSVGMPSVDMPSVTVATFAGPSVALLAGTIASVGTPYVTMPCALRALTRAARPPRALLRRRRARIGAARIRAARFPRQRPRNQPLDVTEVAELLTAGDQ